MHSAHVHVHVVETRVQHKSISNKDHVTINNQFYYIPKNYTELCISVITCN